MAFAGPMRRNLIDRLVKIGVATRLSLASTAALFGDASSQLHSSSRTVLPHLEGPAELQRFIESGEFAAVIQDRRCHVNRRAKMTHLRG